MNIQKIHDDKYAPASVACTDCGDVIACGCRVDTDTDLPYCFACARAIKASQASVASCKALCDLMARYERLPAPSRTEHVFPDFWRTVVACATCHATAAYFRPTRSSSPSAPAVPLRRPSAPAAPSPSSVTTAKSSPRSPGEDLCAACQNLSPGQDDREDFHAD